MALKPENRALTDLEKINANMGAKFPELRSYRTRG